MTFVSQDIFLFKYLKIGYDKKYSSNNRTYFLFVRILQSNSPNIYWIYIIKEYSEEIIIYIKNNISLEFRNKY